MPLSGPIRLDRARSMMHTQSGAVGLPYHRNYGAFAPGNENEIALTTVKKNSQEQTIKSAQPEPENCKPQTEDMEVHHHAKAEKKNFREYFSEGLSITKKD